ncbi:unnamed protein product [Albugo candida]|uniref:Tectonic domain-containing protein n=1 Tax=Albugo candida TaxID=65357 RepID=A0A024GQP3_9STRA|nr:unnamed protein product [Albugo candida]|eukprot:CCI49032.1 unnamed protein product [Albugo candida]
MVGQSFHIILLFLALTDNASALLKRYPSTQLSDYTFLLTLEVESLNNHTCTIGIADEKQLKNTKFGPGYVVSTVDDPACSTGCSCSTEGCCSDVGCCEFGQCLTSSLLYDIKEDYLCTRQQEYLFDIAFFAYDEDTRLFPAPYVRLCTCSSGGAGSSTKQWPYFTYNANTKLCKCYRKVIAAYHSTGSLSGVGEFGPVV